MKKNNKGFTMVELLAAIVILGILMVFAVPIISNMVQSNRDKMYISDAKKMISLVDYQMRAKSSTIDKPAVGDCIIVSLAYLDTSDFKSPPNKGTYEKEYSFVVVKNTGDSLEYSATLIEHLNGGGYKGVSLTTNSNLISKNALSYVGTFEKSELADVKLGVTKSFINSKLGANYISTDNNVVVYNTHDIVDDSVDIFAGTNPKITKFELSSSVGEDYNTLQVKLLLKAEDPDNIQSNLTVYISFDGFKDGEPMGYGDSDTFVRTYDLSTLGYDYSSGATVNFYAYVEDPDGGFDQKVLDYKIHKNLPPRIDEDRTMVSQREGDAFATLTASVVLAVTDEDPTDELLVCLNDSFDYTGTTECDNYQPYATLFGSSGIYDYTLRNCGGQACVRDGLNHYITINVKDSSGALSSITRIYPLSGNTVPVIFNNEIRIYSHIENFTATQSKNVTVDFDVSDDLDTEEQLKITITDGINTQVYEGYSSSGFDFEFGGLYDGTNRVLTVTVTDSEGGSTTVESPSYQVYKNVAPTITHFTASSSDNACPNKDFCPISEGGNLKVDISIGATDDIDYADNYAALQVCLSETESDCDNDENYTPYSNYFQKTVQRRLSGDYDGQSRTLYLVVKDTGGEKTEALFTYAVYEDRPPIINDFRVFTKIVEGNPVSMGSLNTYIQVDAGDDFETADKIAFTLTGGSETVTGWLSNLNEMDYLLGGTYDGGVRNITLVLTDREGSGQSTEPVVYEYTVYQNKIPEIVQFSSESVGFGCTYDAFCPPSMGGNLNANLYVTVSDDLDSYDDLQVCISETASDCSTATSPKFENYDDSFYQYVLLEDEEGNPILDENNNQILQFEPKAYPYTFSGGYDGGTRSLYVVVKDSSGLMSVMETPSPYTYKVYKDSPPKIDSFSLSPEGREGNINTKVAFSGGDDFKSDEELTFTINEYDANGVLITDAEHPVSGRIIDIINASEGYSYRLTGDYDGQTRYVDFVLSDGVYSTTLEERLEYVVGTNNPPEIEGFTVESNGPACPNADLCPVSSGGSKEIVINMNITDDLDELSSLSICVGTTATTCTSSSAVFTNYDTFIQRAMDQGYSYAIDGDYDGTQTFIYLAAKDSGGAIGQVATQTKYKLYKNQGPEISEFKLLSVGQTGSLDTRVLLTAQDDFDDFLSLSYTITDSWTEDGTGISHSETTSGTLQQLFAETGDAGNAGVYRVKGINDGSLHSISLSLTDSNGVTTVQNLEGGYSVFKDQNPIIATVQIQSYDGNPNDPEASDYNPNGCPSTDQSVCPGSYRIKYSLTIEDDTDMANNNASALVCVSDQAATPDQCEDSDYKPYSQFFEYVPNPENNDALIAKPIFKDFTFTVDNNTNPYINVDPNRTFYIHVKDAFGNTSTYERAYQLHQEEAPIIQDFGAIYYSSNQVKKVSFTVLDLFDTYQVCITHGDGSSVPTCTDYSGSYNGSTGDLVVQTYNLSQNLNAGSNVVLYLFVRDSREEAGVYTYVMDNGDTELRKYASAPIQAYSQCDEYDSNNIVSNPKRQFVFNSSKTYYETDDQGNSHPFMNNSPITKSRCSRKCYSDVTTNVNANITAYYDLHLSYADRYDSDAACPIVNDYKTDCSFKDCFKRSDDTYDGYAIGVQEYESNVPITFQYTEGSGENIVVHEVIGNEYYKLYEVHYNDGDEYVTLQRTNTKISPELLSQGVYETIYPEYVFVYDEGSD